MEEKKIICCYNIIDAKDFDHNEERWNKIKNERIIYFNKN